jgi:hypothetical protein
MKMIDKDGHKFIQVGPIELTKTTRDHAANMLVMCDEAGIETDIYSIGVKVGRKSYHLVFARLNYEKNT